MINSQQKLTDQIIPLQTSVMAPIDVMQPNVENEIQVSRNLNEITRKTKDNIVNVDHELKAEEFVWYFLFPYGKNGFKEGRPVKITALDYFQFRILGSTQDFKVTTISFMPYRSLNIIELKALYQHEARKLLIKKEQSKTSIFMLRI
ncbi:hypothetical protein CDAR_584341 [Caerostris darwini]|uniref:Uncharacterized protein n=1 Tax=Caerostris darwini TaxID=1538125 RepID=A0AAV4U4M7_9ARAC|nr:hypothetical protein CDAR_584341 [Caerostris darwini]